MIEILIQSSWQATQVVVHFSLLMGWVLKSRGIRRSEEHYFFPALVVTPRWLAQNEWSLIPIRLGYISHSDWKGTQSSIIRSSRIDKHSNGFKSGVGEIYFGTEANWSARNGLTFDFLFLLVTQLKEIETLFVRGRYAGRITAMLLEKLDRENSDALGSIYGSFVRATQEHARR